MLYNVVEAQLAQGRRWRAVSSACRGERFEGLEMFPGETSSVWPMLDDGDRARSILGARITLLNSDIVICFILFCVS